MVSVSPALQQATEDTLHMRSDNDMGHWCRVSNHFQILQRSLWAPVAAVPGLQLRLGQFSSRWQLVG